MIWDSEQLKSWCAKYHLNYLLGYLFQALRTKAMEGTITISSKPPLGEVSIPDWSILGPSLFVYDAFV